MSVTDPRVALTEDEVGLTARPVGVLPWSSSQWAVATNMRTGGDCTHSPAGGTQLCAHVDGTE
jgi:hypothetical protein